MRSQILKYVIRLHRSCCVQAIEKRLEYYREVTAAMQEASETVRVLDPVARRKLRREVEKVQLNVT